MSVSGPLPQGADLRGQRVVLATRQRHEAANGPSNAPVVSEPVISEPGSQTHDLVREPPLG